MMSNSVVNSSDAGAAPAGQGAAVAVGAEEVNVLNHGVVVFVCVLVIITLVILISFICTRIHLHGDQYSPPTTTTTTTNFMSSINPGRRQDDQAIISVDIQGGMRMGLDETTLRSFPKLLYSQAKAAHCNHNPLLQGEGEGKGKSTVSSPSNSCSICLGKYKETDTLRLLPDCGHLFHLNCVDPWLQLHPTCPICRSSPAPTPLQLANTTPPLAVAVADAQPDQSSQSHSPN